jgi:hypothetical protein
MTKLIRNVFLSSKYRPNKTEPAYDFKVYFPPDYISCNNKQTLTINIINFHMPNIMYNINDNNHTFYIITRNKSTNNITNTQTVNLTNGNYNVYELLSHLNILLVGKVLVSYDKIRNTYSFKDIYNNVNEYINISAPFGKYLGLNNNVEYRLDPITLFESVKPVNMVAYNKIVMNCLGLDYNIGSIENISNDDGFEISNLLFWCSRQDSKYMSELTYNNEDGGDSFNYTLYNKSVDSLRFVVTDEDYNPITDLPDWTMILQFGVEEQDTNDVVQILDVIRTYLLQIYSMMWLLLRRLNII